MPYSKVLTDSNKGILYAKVGIAKNKHVRVFTTHNQATELASEKEFLESIDVR